MGKPAAAKPAAKKAKHAAKKAKHAAKKAKHAAKLGPCSKLPWYKRWWNTIKGWFGSKIHNCIEAAVKKSKKTMIMLKAKKAAKALGLCSKLAWYKRWWNTIKGWFGSKTTNCIKVKKVLSSERILFTEVLNNLAGSVITDGLGSLVNTCSTMGVKADVSVCKCSDLGWTDRWMNTFKGWFGSKPTNCNPLLTKKSGDAVNLFYNSNRGLRRSLLLCSSLTTAQRRYTTCRSEVDLKAMKAAALVLCSKLPWYKSWWNTMKGWFGSKVTNCIKSTKIVEQPIDLKSKKAAVSGACSKLPWYKRWFNTIKGWFGSKVTNCIKAAVKKSKKTMIDLASKKPKAKKAAKALVLCSKLAWYKRWWNTIKGWFGSKTTNCIVAKSAFFEKFGKIVNEGLALELYTQNPTAVLKNLPSFTDNAPMSD